MPSSMIHDDCVPQITAIVSLSLPNSVIFSRFLQPELPHKMSNTTLHEPFNRSDFIRHRDAFNTRSPAFPCIPRHPIEYSSCTHSTSCIPTAFHCIPSNTCHTIHYCRRIAFNMLCCPVPYLVRLMYHTINMVSKKPL